MNTNNQGQALITLLIFSIVGTIIISAAVMMIVVNMITTNKYQQGNYAYYVAESGVENALLRLLRDPSYTGETMSVGTGTAVITVNGSIIKSSGRIGNFVRILEAKTDFSNNILIITSWKEIQ